MIHPARLGRAANRAWVSVGGRWRGPVPRVATTPTGGHGRAAVTPLAIVGYHAAIPRSRNREPNGSSTI